MKRFFAGLVLTLLLSSSCWADRAQYVPELVVTEPGSVWTDVRAFSSLTDAITQVNATGGTLLVSNNIALDDNATIEAGVTLRFANGALIDLNNNELIIYGNIDAGAIQIFDDSDGDAAADTDNVKFMTGVSGGSATVGTNNSVAYPEWWGAVGDANTDSYHAIQCALNCGLPIIEIGATQDTYSGETGIALKVLERKYKVSAPLIVAKSFTTIRGKANSLGNPEISGTYTSASALSGLIQSAHFNTAIEGITIQFPNAVTNVNVYGIYLNGANYSTIKNIRVVNAYHGIFVLNSTQVSIDGYMANGFTGSAVAVTDGGAGGAGCDDFRLNNFVFSGGNAYNCGWVQTGASTWARNYPDNSTCPNVGDRATQEAASSAFGITGAIYLSGKVPAFIITNGDVVLSKYSLVMANNDGVAGPGGVAGIFEKPNGHFTNVIFDSAYSGNVLVNDCGPVWFNSCEFASNCGTSGSNAAGVYVASSTALVFDNCHFSNTAGYGIILAAATADRVIVSNCHFSSIGGNHYYDTYHSPVYPGIFITANVDNFTITGNVFLTEYAFATNNMSYGVYVASGGSDNYIITNNNFGSIRSAPFNSSTYLNTFSVAAIFDGGTGQHKVIDNNLIGSGAAAYQIISSATLPLPASGTWFQVTGTNSISDITNGYRGRMITLYFSDILDVVNNANISLVGGANFTTSGSAILTLVSDASGNWHEVSRSVN